jgi:hypothetical protein
MGCYCALCILVILFPVLICQDLLQSIDLYFYEMGCIVAIYFQKPGSLTFVLFSVQDTMLTYVRCL